MAEYGPFVVTVQASSFDCHSSAVVLHSAAVAGSPLASRDLRARDQPGDLDAIVAGDQPPWFSHRSCGVSGPLARMQPTAALTCV